MIATERLEKIVEMVDKAGIKNIKEMAKEFNVTEMTIRRDCEELEKQGKLIRVRGGAKSIKKQHVLSMYNMKTVQERKAFSPAKEVVCKKAASFVKDGECIFLDGGSSLVPMLKYLQGKEVKIVTHNVAVANLFNDKNSELFLIGGRYCPENNLSTGPITLAALANFNFDHAFIGCLGVDVKKNLAYLAEMDTMAVKIKAMEQAINKYLLIDSSKIGLKGFYSFTNCSEFDAIICDDNPDIDEEECPENFIFVEKENINEK